MLPITVAKKTEKPTGDPHPYHFMECSQHIFENLSFTALSFIVELLVFLVIYLAAKGFVVFVTSCAKKFFEMEIVCNPG